ncbi:MAG: hypothetical protein RIR17_1787, partial [Planctomycetota bacterium]
MDQDHEMHVSFDLCDVNYWILWVWWKH